MKPTFTGSYVFHYMQPEEGTPGCFDSQDFEEMAGNFSHDREHERYSYTYSDDGNETIPEAALDLLLEHLPEGLRDGDYVIISLAGTMNYTSHTDWYSGATECDLVIEPEWHAIRIMTAVEQRNFDFENDIVPLCLREEREGRFYFPEAGQQAVVRAAAQYLNAPDDPTAEAHVKLLRGAIDGVLALPVVEVPPMVAPPLKRCAADRDGDCDHAQCPQLRDGEPKATGRSCPIACWDSDD